MEVNHSSLTVVGAGYAGISALIAALNYLPPTACVTLIDCNLHPGGNWTKQYDFIRLHQPYRLFTAYDQKWARKTPPLPRHHLASRVELLEHFANITCRAAKRCRLRKLFGHRFVNAEERDDEVEVTVRAMDGQNGNFNKDPFIIHTKRLIIATGFNIPDHVPLRFTSSNVTSLSPFSLSSFLKSSPKAPHFYIVGSGKTAMDTILHIHSILPTARITVIYGRSGVAFLNRNRFFPVNFFVRAFAGTTFYPFFLQNALRWDGTNHEGIMQAYIEKGILISPIPNVKTCQIGVMSEWEIKTVQKAVSEWVPGRLIDIVDKNEGKNPSNAPILRLENGTQHELQHGNPIIINCTLTLKVPAATPILSKKDRILTPQFAGGFPGPTAALLTHLWFRRKLPEIVPKLLWDELFSDEREKKRAGFCRMSLVVMNNLSLMANRLPLIVLARDQTNYMRWYPLHRQLSFAVNFKLNARRLQRHAERVIGESTYPM